MANPDPKHNAAEAELQKAEDSFIRLHPYATKGNDVAPITRGELRVILEDLLRSLASGKSATAGPDPEVVKLGQEMGKVLDVVFANSRRIAELEKGAATPAPAKPVNTSGADGILALGRDNMLALAKDNNIDVSGVDGLDDTALAAYIAAAMNHG